MPKAPEGGRALDDELCDARYPCECTEEKFDPEKLQPIAADMAKCLRPGVGEGRGIPGPRSLQPVRR